MRRLITTVIVLIVLGGGSWFGYQRFTEMQASAAEEPTYEIVSVERGSINSTVSATGSIEPESQADLSFRSAGRVAQVLVSVGQPVAEGQLLAQLDTSDLELALEQANVSLQISKAQLQKLETPPSENDLASAQAAVTVAQAGVASSEAALASAQASYRQLLAGATPEELAVQEAQVRQAETSVRQAQQAYDQVRGLPNVGALPQAAQLEQATISYEVARAQLAVTQRGATEAQTASALSQIAQAELSLRQARSQLLTAQNNLETLIEGPAQEDLEIARAQVRQAELSKIQAERSINNARVFAPFTGIVSVVNVRIGELYGGNLPAVTLTDLNSFHMTVLVDELDVRQVQMGQTVRLSLDALPDADITGEVVRVSPTASNVGGVVAYEVEIVPNANDAQLKAGMSATAIITTAEVDNVILVPNRYIQLDRETGQAFVQKMIGGTPALQEIELGLRNDRFSQVVAGLTDSDEVALIRTSTEDRLRGALFGGN
ncbi:HlyD family efflux transporter periplasmic adaptor subunit [bacterium]|nr:HlyD family efflux transporter periplasmic adaptor subunit [bacterium]